MLRDAARRPDRDDQPPAPAGGGRAGEARRGPDAAIASAEKLRRHADGVARTFVDIFVEEIWEPFDRAGRPEEEWPRIREALERMRPLAAEGLLGVFQIAMAEAAEKASERTLRAAAGEASSQKAEKASQTARVAESAGT